MAEVEQPQLKRFENRYLHAAKCVRYIAVNRPNLVRLIVESYLYSSDASMGCVTPTTVQTLSINM